MCWSSKATAAGLSGAANELFKNAADSSGVKRKIMHMYHSDLSLGAQERQGQGRIAPRNQHQVQALRPVTNQLAQKVMHCLAMYGLVVVQHQDEAHGQLLEFVAECDEERRLLRCAQRLQQCEGIGACCGTDRADGGDEVAQEKLKVAVVFVQRQPRCGCGQTDSTVLR